MTKLKVSAAAVFVIFLIVLTIVGNGTHALLTNPIGWLAIVTLIASLVILALTLMNSKLISNWNITNICWAQCDAAVTVSIFYDCDIVVAIIVIASGIITFIIFYSRGKFVK